MCAIAVKNSDEMPKAYLKPFTFSIPDNTLQQALRQQLAVAQDPTNPVVWVDGDAEVLVDPSKLRLALQPGLVLVELPLESDQCGPQKLVIPFSLGTSPADATLLATTESLPRGHAGLAARWGRLAQEALWAALLRLGQDALAAQPAGEGRTVSGIFVTAKELNFIAAQPYRAQELVDYFAEVDPTSPPPPTPQPLPGTEQFWRGCLAVFFCFLAWLLRQLGLSEYLSRLSKRTK